MDGEKTLKNIALALAMMSEEEKEYTRGFAEGLAFMAQRRVEAAAKQ